MTSQVLLKIFTDDFTGCGMSILKLGQIQFHQPNCRGGFDPVKQGLKCKMAEREKT